MLKWICIARERFNTNLPFHISFMGIPMKFPFFNVKKEVEESARRLGLESAEDNEEIEKGRKWVFDNLDAILFSLR